MTELLLVVGFFGGLVVVAFIAFVVWIVLSIKKNEPVSPHEHQRDLHYSKSEE